MMRRIGLYLLLGLAALLSWWLADRLSPAADAVQPKVAHSPDYFSTQVTKTVMNENGTPDHRLVAEAMIHYRDDNTTELTQPVMTFFQESTPPWVIRSEHGLVSADRNDILLGGDVVIRREAAEGIVPVEVITTNLTIHRDSHIAETPDHADLISPPNRISGTGMRVHFQEPKTLTLLANVRGHYEPH